MRILSLFSGIGAFEKALKNLNINYDLVGYCDIDKYASKAYSMVHNVSEDKNFGDITKINADELPKDIDLITYGFPCQDISVAGKQKGFADENGKTRSGLFFDALRIIETTKPKIAIAENVKNLTSKKFKFEFDIVLKSLEEAGYNNYWQVLNAKDYGIPQNRERVFIVSVRKDVDKGFEFPEKQPLKLRLKDLLEDVVDEKYYLSEEKVQKLIKTTQGSSPKHNNKIVEPLKIREATKKGYAEACEWDSVTLDQPNSKTRRGRVGKQLSNTLTTSCNVGVVQIGNIVNTGSWDNPQRGRIYSPEGCSPSLNTVGGGGLEPKIYNNYRIRKLTPRECWRLMGFDDGDFNTVWGISNAQLYKMAGNSIVVDVLEAIFVKLFKIAVDN